MSVGKLVRGRADERGSTAGLSQVTFGRRKIDNWVSQGVTIDQFFCILEDRNSIQSSY